ncbi:MAG TPA: AMP-binding protein [Gemmataceae bacterium]|nr:AMP-binding protein [Gemmataceae bacterium]
MTGEGHRTPIETLSLYPPHGETIGGLLTSRARSAPGRPFLVFRGEVRNYGEVVDLVARAAGLLRARGVTKGDRVAVMASNSDAFVVLFLALASVGAVLVPVNPEFGPAEAAYVFDHAAVSAVACTADTLATARAACAGLARQPWFALLEGTAPDVPIFTDLLSSAPTDAPPDDVTPGDTCLILYTSGTTGFPKGVMHSQQNFVLAGEGFVERMHLQPDDRLFVILPLFHMNALFYSLGGALAAGASLLLVPRFSASEFWRVAAEGGATEVNILAAVGNILTWRPRSEFVAGHHLRKVYGAAMSAETLQVFPSEFGVPTLIEGYGMTEVPGVCHNPFLGPQRQGSIGCPARHPDHGRLLSEMRVLDDEGHEVPVGRTGEIAVRSPIAMQGYYRDTEATAAAFRDGWFLTGDLGYRDADGFFFFVARKKDIVRRRGENISGAEIDRVVGSHPKVQEVAAVAVPSELGEDELLVALVPKPGTDLTPEEIADWCARHLAPHKRPRYVALLDSLPHTPTHRVAKFKLRDDPTLLGHAVDLQRPNR